MTGKPPAPSDLADKFMLRLPDGMRDRIKAAAEANQRSMNSEIVATLEEKYPASEFDLGSFITIWSKRLSTTSDPKKIGRMVAVANEELQSAGSDWRLHVRVRDNGVSVQFMSVHPGTPDDPDS